MKLNFSFKNRPLAFYLKIVVSFLTMITSLIFFILELSIVKGHISFKDNTLITFLFSMFSALVLALSAFAEISFLPVISAILLGVGVGQHLFMCMYPYADLGKGVPFFVDDGTFLHTVAGIFTTFLVLFVIELIAQILITFVDKKSNTNNA